MELQWRIYYGNGQVYSNLDGPPEHSPPFNVQCVVMKDEDVGRVVLHEFDWYIFYEREWWGVVDTPSLIDQLVHDRERKIRAVRMGRSIFNEDFKEIFERSINDPDFPRKSAIKIGERPKGNRGQKVVD